MSKNFKSGQGSNYKRNAGNQASNTDKPVAKQSQFKKNTQKKSSYAKRVTEKEQAGNDPAWYATNAALLRDAASIPYSWPVGCPIELRNVKSGNSVEPIGRYTVPGLLVHSLVPSVGTGETNSSALNVAANSIYAFIRHANSGHKNYDAPDLMLYLLAMSQIYSYIVYLQRTYAFVSLYAQKNRYLPSALLRASGINIDDPGFDGASGLADFRYGINLLINKAAAFAVPNSMTLFNRHAFLYSAIYTEGTTIKDQLYMFNPAGFWRYELDEDSAGCVKFKPFNCLVPDPDPTPIIRVNTTGQYSWYGELLQYGFDLLDQLILSEDINIMSGDILKAYGVDKIIKLAPIGLDTSIVPVFNIAVLEQMKNITIVDDVDYTSLSIYQNEEKSCLVHQPRKLGMTSSSAPFQQPAKLQNLWSERLITTSFDEATPEITMENTRLTAATGLPELDPKYSHLNPPLWSAPINAGSEICVATHAWTFENTTTSDSSRTSVAYQIPLVINLQNSMYTVSSLAILGCFKFRPLTLAQFWSGGEEVGVPTVLNASIPSFDVDNYAVVTPADLARMHEAALMNELNVPSIAGMLSK